MSTCCRKQGRLEGGVAIFVHERVPYFDEDHRVVRRNHVMEHCPVTVLPNHNERDRSVIRGGYRPPEKGHPPYAPALAQMLREPRGRQLATILMGEFNFHPREMVELLPLDLWESGGSADIRYRIATGRRDEYMRLRAPDVWRIEPFDPQYAIPSVPGPSADFRPG